MAFQYLDDAGADDVARRRIGQVAAVEFDATGFLWDQTRYRVQGRALARAVAAEHHGEFAVAHLQGNAMHDRGLAVGDMQVVYFQQRFVGSHVSVLFRQFAKTRSMSGRLQSASGHRQTGIAEKTCEIGVRPGASP